MIRCVVLTNMADVFVDALDELYLLFLTCVISLSETFIILHEIFWINPNLDYSIYKSSPGLNFLIMD